MCNCKQEIEAKLLSRFIESAPEAKSHCAKLEGYTLVLEGNTLATKGFMDIALTAAYPVKKTGEFKEKKRKELLTFNFCPFCGQEYSEEEKDQSNE